MTGRIKIHIIGLSLMPIVMLASAGPKAAKAQGKRLEAYYTATLLGLPIGHISWAVDFKENRFSSVATGSISGFLKLFLDESAWYFVEIEQKNPCSQPLQVQAQTTCRSKTSIA
jgi:hypothetical protein